MTGKIVVRRLNFYYGSFQALKDISLSIKAHAVTAFIGPSGCGKSTLLRTFNRMNDLIEGARAEGQVIIDGRNILAPDIDLVALRKKVGMVFQKPNPFPMSIYDNVAYGLRIHGLRNKELIDEMVEKSLKAAALWEEVKDRLDAPALGLSGGQQQRLCIARVLAVEPEIILMDEPCSALDPISTMKIEELMHELRQKYTLVVVTHNMQQAARISQETVFFLNGEIIEAGATDKMFYRPQDRRTEDYITGRFG